MLHGYGSTDEGAVLAVEIFVEDDKHALEVGEISTHRGAGF